MDKPKRQVNTVEILEELSIVLGLPGDFLMGVMAQDDWSFVVKLHALLELVACTLLATHLKQPALEDVFAEEIDMKARIEMLKALGLLSASERRCMRALGTLRNKLVHSALQTRFSFKDYLSDKDRRKQFAECFGLSLVEDDFVGHKGTPKRVEFIAANARLALWSDVFFIAIKTKTLKERAAAALAVERGMPELLRHGADSINEKQAVDRGE